ETETAVDLARCLDDPRITSVCIGPGLGLTSEDAAKVLAVLESGKSAVLDADALSLLAKDSLLQKKLHESCILTPHAGEFRRLAPDLADALLYPAELRARARDRISREKGLGVALQEVPIAPDSLSLEGPAISKVDVALDAAARFGATVLFKGVDTVIADPKGFAFVHAATYARKAPWLATAGAGDVLAGMIAGRMARQQHPSLAAPPMAWLHVEAARHFGPGLIAEDLPEQIPAVLRALEAAG
ncbi:MAG: ADP/ATP-dependent (S)-NAD(P)H-hydrate dehydratase, partial [Pseudomonadota bacterium]